MERTAIAKHIFGNNFIGPDELMSFFSHLGLCSFSIPSLTIPYSEEVLRACSLEYILILGVSQVNEFGMTISNFKQKFGIDSAKSEPCFYNQDWYLQENFINNTLDFDWYLVRKEVIDSTRSVQPNDILNLPQGINFPSAILCTYTFFAYFFARNEILWKHDFIWCSDRDHNGDRIYVGKYQDVDGVNKNGFSIHRHLSLRSCYGAIDRI